MLLHLCIEFDSTQNQAPESMLSLNMQIFKGVRATSL